MTGVPLIFLTRWPRPTIGTFRVLSLKKIFPEIEGFWAQVELLCLNCEREWPPNSIAAFRVFFNIR